MFTATSIPESDRWRIYAAVNRAVKSGCLEKTPCVICGAEKVVAHHEDYERPLSVVWYCHKHHLARHNGEIEASPPAALDLPHDAKTPSARGGNNHPIAIRRVRMGLTQTELGDIVATRQHRISEWESGARRPGLQNLGKLAKAFGVTAGTLLNEMNAWSATR